MTGQRISIRTPCSPYKTSRLSSVYSPWGDGCQWGHCPWQCWGQEKNITCGAAALQKPAGTASPVLTRCIWWSESSSLKGHKCSSSFCIKLSLHLHLSSLLVVCLDVLFTKKHSSLSLAFAVKFTCFSAPPSILKEKFQGCCMQLHW